jgi:hypothetical protein
MKKTMNLFRIIVPVKTGYAIAAACALGGTTASAFDAVLTADSAVALKSKPVNMGAYPTLPVNAGHNALFKFNYSLLPAGTTADQVSVATLTVFVNRVTASGAVSLFSVNGDWSEAAVPDVTFTPLAGSSNVMISASDKNSFVCFDVTGLVKSWMGGATNDGVAIGADPSAATVALTLDSKENIAGGHCATLDIELAGAAGVANNNGTNLPGAVVTNTETGVSLSGTFSGNGGGLTNLDASQLTSIGNGNLLSIPDPTQHTSAGNFFVGPSGNATMGGSDNTAIGTFALSGNTSGSGNTADGAWALYSNTNGSANTANGCGALGENTTGGDNTAIGYQALTENKGGSYNTAVGAAALWNIGNGSASGGGSYNIALGFYAGYNIFNGSSNIDIGNEGYSTDTNIIRIGSGQTATYLSGTVYGTVFSPTSDRNAKERFTPINPQSVLAKVAALPISEWKFKSDAGTRHIGPMAQDFYSAFEVGTDDKHIATVDEEGVALAAIQGLNQKLNEKDAQIEALKQQNDSLAARLNELETTVKSLAGKK